MGRRMKFSERFTLGLEDQFRSLTCGTNRIGSTGRQKVTSSPGPGPVSYSTFGRKRPPERGGTLYTLPVKVNWLWGRLSALCPGAGSFLGRRWLATWAGRLASPVRFLSFGVVVRSLAAGPGGRFRAPRRLQVHSRPTGLRKSDCNGLLGGASPVFAFPNMVHLFAHELSRLGARRLALRRILARSLACLRVRHVYLRAKACNFASASSANRRTGLLNRDKVWCAGTQPLPPRRLHSNSTIPAATETFSDAMAPAIGMRTSASQCCFTS